MGEQQRQPLGATLRVQRDRMAQPVAFGDTHYNNHDKNVHSFCYYNCAVPKAPEFASGHLETESQSVNMHLKSRVATGLDPRKGMEGFYSSPPRAASPSSSDPKGPPGLSPSTPAPYRVRPAHLAVRGLPDPGTPLLGGDPERTCVPSPERPGVGESQARVRGALRRGARGRAGTGARLLQPGAGTRGAEP